MKVSWLLLLSILMPASVAAQNKAPRNEEIITLLDQIESRYAYPALSAEQFSQLRGKYVVTKPLTNREYVRLLEDLLAEFHDNHLQLNTNLADSPRLVPSQSPILATWHGQTAIVSALFPSFTSNLANVRLGSVILKVDGEPVIEAVQKRLNEHQDRSSARAMQWALDSVIAGRRNKPVVIEVQDGPRRFSIYVPTEPQPEAGADITACRLKDGTHYLRFEDSLGRTSTIESFERQLPALQQSSSVILDLRNTPSGGNSLVARGILGHFVSQPSPYQMHEFPQDEREYGIPRRWLELVSPLVPRILKPVKVLVGPWTGSMGEGLAIGFDATQSATVAGERMAQLRGATSCVPVPSLGSDTCINLPTERLYHVSGAARELFTPRYSIPAALLEPWIMCRE